MKMMMSGFALHRRSFPMFSQSVQYRPTVSGDFYGSETATDHKKISWTSYTAFSSIENRDFSGTER